MYYNRFLRRVGTFFSIYVLFFSLSPLFFGVWHTGVFMSLLFGLALLFTCLFWDRPGRVWRHLKNWVLGGLCAAMAFGGVCSALMLVAAFRPPQEPATVVVLGCQVIEDQPSLMLRYRLEAALRYLDAHPEAPVVCSGGTKGGGPFSEGAVMKKWLLEHGVQEERIFVEGTSRNTQQNVEYSASIIREHGLPQQAAFASDGFHQFRAGIYAQRYGLGAGALPCLTPWGLAPTYWVREWFAIVKAVLL